MPVRTDFTPGDFCWVDLAAFDLESAAKWYGDLFGWELCMQETHGGPPYGFLTKDGEAVGGIGQLSDEMKAQGIPPVWNSYVMTADCAATEAKVAELGGTVTVPTMEIPGYGKLAFFLDPEGASFAAWQSTAEDSRGLLVHEPGGLSWNELMTRSTDKAASFYGALFGWEFASMPMGDVEYTMVKSGGKDTAGMMPMVGPQSEGVPSHWMVYFTTADCAASSAKAEATGGTILVPPTEIPVGKFSMLRDPQGGAFSLIEHAQAPQ